MGLPEVPAVKAKQRIASKEVDGASVKAGGLKKESISPPGKKNDLRRGALTSSLSKELSKRMTPKKMLHGPEAFDDPREEEQHKRELMAMNAMVMRMSQPICFSGSGQAGSGGGDEDSALAVPDGWSGAFGKYLVHEPILGIGEYQVLEAHIARQKVELSDLRVQARAKQKELTRLTLMYRDDCLEFAKTSAKEYNLPPGTPINMPVILMERKLQANQEAYEATMNRQRCYDHICTRTYRALSALKLELAKREREMRRLVCTEENAASDMAMVSAKAQEAVVKLKREMDNQFLRKVHWNVMTNWAHGVVTMIDEGNRMLEHQLKKKEHIIMAMDTYEARVREKDIRKRVPALYVEAIKTLRANKHINAITVAGTILKKHTGVMQPEEWVGAITDKLGDFKVSEGGHVEPSNRFLLTRKTEELHQEMDALKQKRCALQDELERLRFEEGTHLDPAARPEHTEVKADEVEMQLMLAEKQRMLTAMRREKNVSQKTQVNITRRRQWLLTTQNSLTLLMERLNTIHCLGRPLTTTGAVDDDGILPVAALQQLCAHLTTRFGRLAELQGMLDQFNAEAATLAPNSNEMMEAMAGLRTRMNRLRDGDGEAPALPLHRVDSAGGVSSPRHSVSSQRPPSSTRTNTPPAAKSRLGMEPAEDATNAEALMTEDGMLGGDGDGERADQDEEQAGTHEEAERAAAPAPAGSPAGALMKAAPAVTFKQAQAGLHNEFNTRLALKTRAQQAIEEEEEEDEDDDLYDDGTLTRHEVKFGKEPPPKPATPKKGVSVRSLAAKAKAARTTDPIITLTPGWRNRCARGEAPRPSWDMEPAWEGEELLMLDARGRLQPNKGIYKPPGWKRNRAVVPAKPNFHKESRALL